MSKENKSIKLFFAIFKDETKAISHMIVYRHSKKDLTAELKEKGYVVKYIFNQKDIDMIEKEEFYTDNVSDKDIDYVKNHLEEWEKSI